jgi:hypothetical protein
MVKFKMKKWEDPRCIEYYMVAFPELSMKEMEKVRDNWISRNIKKEIRNNE